MEAVVPWPSPYSGGNQAGRLSTLHLSPLLLLPGRPPFQACGHPGVHHQPCSPHGAGAAPQPRQVGTTALIFSLFRGHGMWHAEPPHLVMWPRPLQGVRKASPPRAGREEDPVHVSEQRQPPPPNLSSTSPGCDVQKSFAGQAFTSQEMRILR